MNKNKILTKAIKRIRKNLKKIKDLGYAQDGDLERHHTNLIEYYEQLRTEMQTNPVNEVVG